MSDSICTLYLIRHGESEGNAQGIVMGHHDLSLTAKGKRQAEIISHALEGTTFAAIFSSNLRRAYETAQVIAQTRNLPVQKSYLLRERGYGVHEGKEKKVFDIDTKMIWDSVKNLSDEEKETFQYPDGIENDLALYKRVSSELRKIASARLGENVIVVTHGSAIKHFLRRIALGDVVEQAVETGGYVKVLFDGKGFALSKKL